MVFGRVFKVIIINILHTPVEEHLIHRDLSFLFGQILLTVYCKSGGDKRKGTLLLKPTNILYFGISRQQRHSPGNERMLFMLCLCFGCITVASVFSETEDKPGI